MTAIPFEQNSHSIWLEFSEAVQQEAWDASTAISPVGQQLCYLNLLSQQVVLAYLQEYEPTAGFEAHGEEFWALGINGSEVVLGDQRLLILPTDEFDIDEFRIPQEWVDCAELAADFYVAVQVDTEQRWLRIWGYTTHATLMEKGCYGGRDRTYILAQDAVSESINALWLTRQYYAEAITQNKISPLPTLSLDQMTSVLDELVQSDPLFLRRAVPVQAWGALVSSGHWRRVLLERLRPTGSSLVPSGAVQLNYWFKNRFEEGWKGIQELIAPELMGAFMGNQVKRAKLIDLKADLAGCSVVLMITLGQTEQGVSVKASVYPTRESGTLPAHLKLSILDEGGVVFRDVISRSDDEFIQYQFEAEPEDRFSVKVALGAASIVEQFQV